MELPRIRRRPTLCGTAAMFCVLLSACFVLADDEKDKDEATNDPLKMQGPIQKIQEPLAEVVNLRWVKGRLETSFPESYDEAETPIDVIREEFGYGDGSSYGSPNYRLGFGDSKLTGFLDRSKKGKSGYRTAISLREISKPHRSLNISTNEEGDFTAIIRSPENAYLLRIRQQPDGQFVVQEISGTDVFSVKVADFNAFMSLHRKFAIERLLPAMKEFGVGKLISPYNKEVQRSVLKHLKPLEDEQRKQTAEMVAELDSDQYQIREDATEKLRSEFPDNSELLTRVFLSTDFSPEVRSRMRLVFVDESEQDEIDMLDFLTSSNLLDEVPYLVWLLDTELEAADRKHVIERFQHVSKLTITPDSPEWKEWIAEQPFAKPVDQTPLAAEEQVDFKPLLSVGTLKKASPHISKIVRVVFDENSLALDREHWTKPFGGKTIEELTKELEKEFVNRNIPKNWFNKGGRSSMSNTGNAQVLFELMHEELKGDSEDFVDEFDAYGESNGWDFSFSASKMRARLNIPNSSRARRRSSKKNGDSKTRNVKPFHFYVQETAEPYREVAIDESRTSFSVNFVCQPLDISIQMIQNESGVLLQDIRGLQVLALQEPTFRELYEKNTDYFTDEFFPVLQYMGIRLAPEVAVPLTGTDDEGEKTKDGDESSEGDSDEQESDTSEVDESESKGSDGR